MTIILFRYNFAVVINIIDRFSGIFDFVSMLFAASLQVPGRLFQTSVSAQWTEVQNLFIAYKRYVGIYF